MGSTAGVKKTAANRLGLSLADYEAHLAAGQKWCTACKAWHLRSAFGADRSRADGLSSACLAGRTVAEDRPGQRERRLKKAQGLAWCRGCTAWLPCSDVSGNGLCRPHAAAEARAHYAANPDAVRLRKTARTRGLAPIPPWWWKEKVAEFGGLCAYGCGRPSSTVDHVWPVSRGGESRPSNLVPACRLCNSSKKDRHPGPWIDLGFMAFPDQWEALIDLNFVHGGPLEEVA